MDESTPLLPSERKKSLLNYFWNQQKVQTEFKCWCCWSYESSPANPLIRVCQGCKDPELQYIHQECIDSYITALPLPRRPRSPRPQEQSVQEFLEARPILYDCTRCRDPYVVVEINRSPLSVIWEDGWLRSVFSLVVAACVLMTLALFGLLFNEWESDIPLFIFFGFMVTVLRFAFALTVAGLISGLALAGAIWKASSGTKRLHVIGEPLVQTP